MGLISSLLPKAKLYLPLCIDPLIVDHLQQAAVDFCRKTMVQVDVYPSVAVTGESSPYVVPAGDGKAVFRILSVSIDGLPLERSDLTSEGEVAFWRTATGVPQRFVEEANGVISVFPTPWQSCLLEVEAAVEPTGDTLDDAILAEYWRGIMSGAIALLSMIPGKPWSSVEAANYHQSMFNEAVADAKEKLHRNRSIGLMRTRIKDL